MTPSSRLQLRGDLILPRDPQYDDARRIHNGMINRHPALIARCADAGDVIAALRFARERDMPLSIRGGGHGVAGFALNDGGMVIDLSRMRDVQVDPASRVARAAGGATWGDVDGATQTVGLATTGGVARPTGVAGLTLGGGHGFLMRRYGLACDNLISAQIVTAAGERLHASAQESPDLFWALQGGGGNFGIATELQFQLHAVDQVLGGLLIYPLESAGEVFSAYREMTAEAPDELGSLAVLGRLPDGTPIAVVMICYTGDPAPGERLLKPMRECAPLLADQVAPMPYLGLQSIVESFNPAGLRNYWKSCYLSGLPGEAVETMRAHFATAPAGFTHLVVEHLGGAVSRVPESSTAVAHRDALYNLLIVGIWEQTADDEPGITWVRELRGLVQPFATKGAYVNYLGAEAGEMAAVVQAAYTPRTLARLREVKRKFDPLNLFRSNHNIIPA